MGTKKVQTRIRQDQIAQAVLHLISRHGLKGLSVAGVAAEIGLVPSALYRHFTGKEEMVDAALKIIRRKLLGNIGRIRAATGDSLERLEGLSRGTLEIMRGNQAIPRIVFSEDAVVDQPKRKRMVRRLIKSFLRQVKTIIVEGQTAGRIRVETDADAAAVFFLGLIQPAAILFYLHEGKYDAEGHRQKAWGLFRRAIEKETSGAESERRNTSRK
jgi:TetR/AcrR family transcriptional regulator, fatty acid metabolism regulator protein